MKKTILRLCAWALAVFLGGLEMTSAASEFTMHQSPSFRLNGAKTSLFLIDQKIRTQVTLCVIAPRRADGRLREDFGVKYEDVKVTLYTKSGEVIPCPKAFKSEEFFMPILVGIGGFNGHFTCRPLDLNLLSKAVVKFRGLTEEVSLRNLK